MKYDSKLATIFSTLLQHIFIKVCYTQLTPELNLNFSRLAEKVSNKLVNYCATGLEDIASVHIAYLFEPNELYLGIIEHKKYVNSSSNEIYVY